MAVNIFVGLIMDLSDLEVNIALNLGRVLLH